MASSTAAPLSWDALPTEMKYSVVAHLECDDVRNFAKVNKEAYTIAVPALWKVRIVLPISRVRAQAHILASLDCQPGQFGSCTGLHQPCADILPSIHSATHCDHEVQGPASFRTILH